MDKKKIPEIRFEGYTDEWEERKLGEIGKCQSGVGFPDAEQGGTEGIPFFKVSDMNNQGNETEMIISNNYVSEEQMTRKKWKPIEEVPAMFFAKVGAAVMLNRKRLVTLPFLLDNNTMAYKFSKEWDAQFGKAVFETIYLPGLAQTGALPSYNAGDVEDLSIFIPLTKEEQKKVGMLFQNIDNLITLHQRKLDKLVLFKKSMLDKMFPKNGAKVPEIRFSGFTDDWEQRKVECLIEEYKEVTTQNNQYPALTSSRKGIFLQTEYFAGHQVASEDNTGYNIVPRGYFTYRHMSDDEIFYFNINDIVDNGIVSTLYPVFKAREGEVDSYFLQYILNNGYEFRHFAILQKQGGSRTYMYLNKLKELFLTIPSKYEEQCAISKYFCDLDHLITLHQRKLGKLKTIKKSLLEKMFV